MCHFIVYHFPLLSFCIILRILCTDCTYIDAYMYIKFKQLHVQISYPWEIIYYEGKLLHVFGSKALPLPITTFWNLNSFSPTLYPTLTASGLLQM